MVTIKCYGCGETAQASRRKVNCGLAGRLPRTLNPPGWNNADTTEPLCPSCNNNPKIWHRLHQLYADRRAARQAANPEAYARDLAYRQTL